jgi:ATP-dependent Lon protease
MTGEITLSGLVLPVGGIKGKVLAARRSGMKRVVLPKKNEADLKDIPEEALRDLEVELVERIDDALNRTLTTTPEMPPDTRLPEPEATNVGTELRAESGQARAQAERTGTAKEN